MIFENNPRLSASLDRYITSEPDHLRHYGEEETKRAMDRIIEAMERQTEEASDAERWDGLA